MIARKDSVGPHSSDSLPNSQKVYVPGKRHKDVRVPVREIALSPTRGINGRIEVNEPVRVYDTSGAWSDPAFTGNETTGRLIGWLAKLLAENPDQRRAVVEDRSLIPNVIDEALRFEPTGHAVARYVMKDVEYHGTTIPAGSPVLLLLASANRDPRRYRDPEVFDIHRADIQHLTFGYGLHFCLGANLARLEGRVALDELLERFPEWDVDHDGMRLAPTSTVRGWERMPIVLPPRSG